MGDVIPLRKPLSAMPDSVHDTIGRAYRLAVSRLHHPNHPTLPRHRVCTVILNRIADDVRRGMRDVQQLSNEALSYLEKISEC